MSVSGPALLLDENLSPRLVTSIALDYPGSCHVDTVGLHGRPDFEVWIHAKERGFVLVSKDNDFRQLSFLHGAPPKVVWLRIGNAPTSSVRNLLCARKDLISAFAHEAETALLPIFP